MNTIHNGASDAPTYCHAVDVEALRPRFNDVVDDLSAQTLSAQAMTRALDGGIAEITTVLRAIPAHEGRLLERGIGLLAELNPELIVLTQNLRLPVTPAALQLVEKNDPGLFRSLTLDADSGGRKSYTPDLLIVNRRSKVAHVVDVKRSLGSYEVARINELKSRMLAAALVVPDLLYKEHRRLIAEDVRVVIINAENQRTDIAGGIWPLAHLDHLLAVSGAGEAIAMLRTLFHARMAGNWDQARRSCAWPAGGMNTSKDISAAKAPSPAPDREPAIDTVAVIPARLIGGHVQVGFARIPKTASG
jgi:hypothetical protein